MADKIVIALDSTQLKLQGDCDLARHYAYDVNLRLWNSNKKALDMGTLAHSLLEVFYTLRCLDPKTDRYTHLSAVKKLFKEGKFIRLASLTADDEKFIFARFLDYVNFYINNDFMPLKRGIKPGVEIGFSKKIVETEHYIGILEGKIDLIHKLANGAGCWVDHKTRGQKKNLYGWKPQSLTYSLATGFNYGMFNYFGTAKDFKPTTFERKLFYIPDWRIADWELHVKKKFESIYQSLKTYQIRNQYEITHLDDYFEPNPSACGGMWESNPCPFTRICEEKNRAIKEAVKKHYYKVVPKWSPWNEEDEDVA